MTTPTPDENVAREPVLAARIGDFMQTAETLKLALGVAEAATRAAEQYGAPGEVVARYRDLIARLRL